MARNPKPARKARERRFGREHHRKVKRAIKRNQTVIVLKDRTVVFLSLVHNPKRPHDCACQECRMARDYEAEFWGSRWDSL